MHAHCKNLHPHGGAPFDPSALGPSIDEDTPRPVRVFHLMREVTRLTKTLMVRRLADEDAHLGQAFSLLVISRREGMTQADLAGALGIARPTVTIMLKKMERAGLIERRADEHDQRYSRIYLTAQGRELQGRLHEVHEGIVRDIVAPLSDDDQRELERLLGLLIDNVNAAQERG